MMECEKCGSNDFLLYDEVAHNAKFTAKGEITVGAETDNTVSEIVCKDCSTPVDLEKVEVIW